MLSLGPEFLGLEVGSCPHSCMGYRGLEAEGKGWDLERRPQMQEACQLGSWTDGLSLLPLPLASSEV